MKGKKTGGRVAGTPNKVSSVTKKVIVELLTEYHDNGMLSEDFYALEPKDRIQMSEKFMAYVMPKMQSVEFREADETSKTIEDALIELSKPKDSES